ncbi:MAG: hypothetical protein WAU36_04130 [Cyclobacteriaceae bacterium]|jgi:hypothetical protein
MSIKRSELREIEYSPNQAPGGKRGWFHRWSSEPFDSERSGYISKTYAIIEMEDGKIKTVEPGTIQFKDQFAY